jgi:hypothetical protein
MDELKPLPIDPWQEKMLEQRLSDKQAMIAACGVPRSYLANPNEVMMAPKQGLLDEGK